MSRRRIVTAREQHEMLSPWREAAATHHLMLEQHRPDLVEKHDRIASHVDDEYRNQPRDQEGRVQLWRGVGEGSNHMTFHDNPDPSGADQNPFHYSPPTNWDEAEANMAAENQHGYGNYWGTEDEAKFYAGDANGHEPHGAMAVSAWFHPHDIGTTQSWQDGVGVHPGSRGQIDQAHVYHRGQGWTPLSDAPGKTVTASLSPWLLESRVTLPYQRNNGGMRGNQGGYGQEIEPWGRYMSDDTDSHHLPLQKGWERGQVDFDNPLYVPHEYGAWKQSLSQAHGGLTGQGLSQALLAKGHDGVITHDKYGIGEIVDIRPKSQRGHRVASVDRHPDVPWQERLFGCAHTSCGRHLPVGRTAAAFDDPAGWANSQSFAPSQLATQGTQGYHNLMGTQSTPMDFSRPLRTRKSVQDVGRAYDSLPDFDPRATKHFDAMRDEVGKQYDHLTNTMGVHVQPVSFDPYPDVHHMVNDLQNNKRLQVLSTASTGGHPYFSDEDNDKFRAVHDAFGHAATGRGFDRHGEEAAYLKHAQMFSPAARSALASETRGQNSSLILNGQFGPQKVATMDPRMFTAAAGEWYHGSPQKLEPGTKLTPGGGPSAWGNFYNPNTPKDDPWYEGDRQQHVWLTDNPDSARNWAQSGRPMGGEHHVYRVQPEGDPQVFRDNPGEGWTTPSATILNEHTASATNPPLNVPVEHLVPHMLYDRSYETKPYFQDLLKDMKLNGAREPVTMDTDGTLGVLSDGNHRLAAARKLGMSTLPVQFLREPTRSLNREGAAFLHPSIRQHLADNPGAILDDVERQPSWQQGERTAAAADWTHDPATDSYTHPNGHVLKPSDEKPGTHQLWAPTTVMRGPAGLAKDKQPHSDLQKHMDWAEKTGSWYVEAEGSFPLWQKIPSDLNWMEPNLENNGKPGYKKDISDKPSQFPDIHYPKVYADPAKANDKWYHVSPEKLKPGDKITPHGAPPSWPEFYDKQEGDAEPGDEDYLPPYDNSNRLNHVFISPNLTESNMWSDKLNAPNVYEVKPGDKPDRWNFDGHYNGWVTPHAHVTREVSREEMQSHLPPPELPSAKEIMQRSKQHFPYYMGDSPSPRDQWPTEDSPEYAEHVKNFMGDWPEKYPTFDPIGGPFTPYGHPTHTAAQEARPMSRTFLTAREQVELLEPWLREAVDTSGMDPDSHAYHERPKPDPRWQSQDGEWNLPDHLERADEAAQEGIDADDDSGYNWGPEPRTADNHLSDDDMDKLMEEARGGGFSFRNRPGDGPTSGTTVGRPKSEGHEEHYPFGELSPDKLHDRINDKREVIESDPDNLNGGWKHTKPDKSQDWYNDVSKNFKDPWDAAGYAVGGDQKSVYDLDGYYDHEGDPADVITPSFLHDQIAKGGSRWTR